MVDCDELKIDELINKFDWELCSVIGEWYLVWRLKIVDYDQRTHSLGFAKEELKGLICNKVREVLHEINLQCSKESEEHKQERRD